MATVPQPLLTAEGLAAYLGIPGLRSTAGGLIGDGHAVAMVLKFDPDADQLETHRAKTLRELLAADIRQVLQRFEVTDNPGAPAAESLRETSNLLEEQPLRTGDR